MTSWTTPSTPGKRAAVRGDDPAARTPHCDVYCLLWLGVRLHSPDCQVANRMDPVFPDRKIDDVLGWSAE